MKVLTVSGLILLCLALAGCQRMQARRALAKQNVPLTVEAFVQSAREGNVENLRLFLQAEMNINAAAADGQTAFSAAVAERQRPAADFLLQHGADINANTPLIKIVADGDAEWLNYLLENGANPNLADADHRTPLTVTTDTALLTILLHAGAQPDERGVVGQPLLVWAVTVKNHALVKELLERGANADTQVHTPARNRFVALVGDPTLEYYLIKDTNVTPLMLSAGVGDLEMTRLLLKHGAKKFRQTGRTTTTAIYIACVNHRTPVIQVLLGKDPERQRWRVNVSLRKQRLTVTRDGEVWLRAPISSGAKDFETPRGEFVVTNKYEEWHSNLYDDALMPFFLRLNCSAVGLHAGALPGYPASHGCIRLSATAAEKIFQNVEIGTVVTIE